MAFAASADAVPDGLADVWLLCEEVRGDVLECVLLGDVLCDVLVRGVLLRGVLVRGVLVRGVLLRGVLVGEVLPVGLLLGEAVRVGELLGAALLLGLPARTLVVREAVHVTVAPPPLPEPLH